MIHHDGTNPKQLAWKLSLPIVFIYLPLSMGFGVFFMHSGFAWYWAPIMSLFAYGGSVQFVAVGILMNHGSLLELVIATVSLSSRNAFYGLSFLDRFHFNKLEKLYFIQSLVDSNYAILTHHAYRDEKHDRQFSLYLAFFIQMSWVLGSFIGAFFADSLTKLPSVIFILVAFFIVMIYEYYCTVKTVKPFIYAISSVIVAFYFTGNNFLLLAILLSCAMLMLDKRLPLSENKGGT
jgi:4-azaleucine resistance transporter AzlC